MDFPNAYFLKDDPHPRTFHGYELPSDWWSRPAEYAWAIQYAAPWQIVADMGCGWHYRPFHDALSDICHFTYGVDSHPGILELPSMKNGAFVVADFSQPILAIDAHSLDRIFCISVLEETIGYANTLGEFARLLKPDGRIVITMDAPFDKTKPEHEKYKGVNLPEFEEAMKATGLRYDGSVSRVLDMDNAIYHDAYNLCCWHCVLKVT
jgi:SAM-dependent methyltransferase